MHIVMITSNQALEIFEKYHKHISLLDLDSESKGDIGRFLWQQHSCIQRHLSFMQTWSMYGQFPAWAINKKGRWEGLCHKEVQCSLWQTWLMSCL